MKLPDALELATERRRQGVWQHRDPVPRALAVAHDDLAALELTSFTLRASPSITRSPLP